MGVVLAAEDIQLGRRVALKVMRRSLAANPRARQRFLREARATAALRHDNVVTIYQVGEEGGVPFLAMELLDGEALEERLRRVGRLPPAEVLRIGRETAQALAAAHAKGLIHRDIKPGNLWLEKDSNRVKVLDFGLAYSAAEDVQLTQSGTVVGTPTYMAPEQARGESVDGRSDLFSLGCVLYRALTGREPFRGPNVMATLAALATQDPRPVRELAPEVPPALADLVRKLLAKNPADRYPSASALVEALRAIDVRPPERPRGGRRRLLVMAGCFLGLLAAGLVYAPSVIRIVTNTGELVLEADDRDVEVTVQRAGAQPEVHILDRHTQRALVVTAGDYDVRVQEKDGLQFRTKQFTLRRGGREVVTAKFVPATVPSATPPRPAEVVVDPASTKPSPPLPDKERPFVLVRKEGRKQAFKTFSDALVEQKNGDAIEVHDNGPFPVPAAVLDGRGLVLRAAPGYRPVFVAQIEAGARRPWLALLGGEVLVEGCDFHGNTNFPGWFLDSGPEPKPAAPWTFRNCRFWVNGARGLLACAAPRLLLEDCQIVGAFGEAVVSLALRADLEMTNNLVSQLGPQAIVASGNQTLRLTNNTFDTGLMTLLRPPLDEAPARPVTVVAEGNLFWNCRLLAGEGGGMPSEKVARTQVKWQGKDNLYARGYPYVSFAQDQRELKRLDEWNRLWGRDEPGSVEIPWMALQYDSVSVLDPRLVLRTVRQEVEALGRRLGAGARNVGPDWNLVGPGDAYVAARERASGKLVTKEQLRPPAPAGGPFVLLRNQEAPRGHATLQAALDAAQDGDVIEVRTDGPFPGVLLKAPERGGRLTIRAAPGYRPAPQTRVHLELPKADVEIEGLAFTEAGHVSGDYGRLTLRNCTLWSWKEDVMDVRCVLHGPGQAVRFINSLFRTGPACSVGPGQGILFENCIVSRSSIDARADDDDCEMVIRRCVCWGHGPGEGSVACGGNPRARPRVHAEDTVFIGGAVLTWSARQARWSGTHNLYSLTAGFAVGQPFYTLESWQKRWDSDRDSLLTLSPFLEPRMYRFMPGQPKRPDGKDYGADVDKVATTPVPSRADSLRP